MRNALLFILPILVITAAACKKEPEQTQKRTSVTGRLLSKYSNEPVAGRTVSLIGERPLPPCLFCATTAKDELRSTVTDLNGRFSMSIDTTDIYTAMRVGTFGFYTPVTVGSDNTDVVAEAHESMILRETFHVTNNTNAPLFIEGPYYFQQVKVLARDTTFTVFNTANPNETIANKSFYTDNTGTTRTRTLSYSTSSFVDTLDLRFEVDAASF